MTIDIAIVRSYLVLVPNRTMTPFTIQITPRKRKGKARSAGRTPSAETIVAQGPNPIVCSPV